MRHAFFFFFTVCFLTNSIVSAQLAHEYVFAQEDLQNVNPAALNSIYISFPHNPYYRAFSARSQLRRINNEKSAKFTTLRFEKRSDRIQYAFMLQREDIHVHHRNQFTFNWGKVLENRGGAFSKGRKRTLNFGGSFHVGWNGVDANELRYAEPGDLVTINTSSYTNIGAAVGVFHLRYKKDFSYFLGGSFYANYTSLFRENTYHTYGLLGGAWTPGDNFSLEVSGWCRPSWVKRPNDAAAPSSQPPITLNYTLRCWFHNLKRKKTRGDKFGDSYSVGIGRGHFGPGITRIRFSGAIAFMKEQSRVTVSSVKHIGIAFEYDNSEGLSFGKTYELYLSIPFGYPFGDDKFASRKDRVPWNDPFYY